MYKRKTYPAEDRQPLLENERKELGKAIIGFGNLKKVVVATGITGTTIKHAIAGFLLNPPTRERLRNYLNSLNQPA